MKRFTGYPNDAMKFLRQLTKNNRREWFQENKTRYETEIVEPTLRLIEALEKHIAKVSEAFLAVAKKTGGSMMRIYRDTRFAKDKTPYKTNIGVHVRHRLGKDVHAPGFYVHVAPNEVFVGAGVWRPQPKVAAQIRARIQEEPSGWEEGRAWKSVRPALSPGR